MKKPILTAVLLLILFLTSNCYSQGWVSNSPNTIVAYNSGLTSDNNLRIGLGTTSPSAQLHATGTIRFSGLTNNSSLNRIMATDINGNVFYRDASTLGTNNAWLLTGNAGTSATVNFVGTTDNQDLVFRTVNNERMKLLTDGALRLRPNPNGNLFIRDSPNQPGENDNIGLDFIRNDAADNAIANPKARIQFDGYPLAWPSDPTLLNTGYIRFFTNDSLGNFQQRMVITQSGNVAIGNIYNYPSPGLFATRPFEVNCNNNPIRLRNLATGVGSTLVIDVNGDVRIGNAIPKLNDEVEKKLQNDIEILKGQIEELKRLINKLCAEKQASQSNPIASN